jgi:predicted ferric reductase
MLLAGTACLVMTVATSLRAARRRLRYESWHLLHLYAYLGVGLALPHQLWTGQEFLASTAATVFWWSLWALAAGAVSVHLTGRHLDRLPAQAGQFLTWRFLHRQGWPRGAPTSSPSTGAAGPVLPGHRRASDSWLGAGVGAADDVTALTWWVPDLAERDVYVCGPEDWIETVRRVTQAAGLPADQLHIEKFRW